MTKSRFVESYKNWVKESDNEDSGYSLSERLSEINNFSLKNMDNYETEIFEIILSMAMGSMHTEFIDLFGYLESQIEKLLCGALIVIAQIKYGLGVNIMPFNFEWKFGLGSGPDSLTIEPQKQIGDYRVDLILEYKDEILSWRSESAISSHLVVECDGHDFHEKTKQQAQKDKERDRILQSCGYPVFRFTGSEIWKNPFDCAESIMKYLQERAKQSAHTIGLKH